MQVFVHCAVNRSNRFTRQAGPLPVLGYCVNSIARPDGRKKGDWQGRLARWQAAYGQPNISTAPIAGCLTPRPRKSIRTSVRAVSIARFAGSRSMHGLAPMTSSAGRPIRRARPSLGKRSDRPSIPNALGTPSSRLAMARVQTQLPSGASPLNQAIFFGVSFQNDPLPALG